MRVHSLAYQLLIADLSLVYSDASFLPSFLNHSIQTYRTEFSNDYILLGILKIHLSYVLYMLSMAMI